MKGPAIFLAQFAGDKPPFDKPETMAQWAAGLGYVGVQVPTDPYAPQFAAFAPPSLRDPERVARLGAHSRPGPTITRSGP